MFIDHKETEDHAIEAYQGLWEMRTALAKMKKAGTEENIIQDMEAAVKRVEDRVKLYDEYFPGDLNRRVHAARLRTGYRSS